MESGYSEKTETANEGTCATLLATMVVLQLLHFLVVTLRSQMILSQLLLPYVGESGKYDRVKQNTVLLVYY